MFLYLDLVKFQFFLNFLAFKTILEIMFIDVLDRKESCFCVKKFNRFFANRLMHAFFLKNANAWVNPFGKM